MDEVRTENAGQWLLRLGMGLFLLGLLTGFAIPLLENPRMGLASHLEGVLNGLFLLGLGLLWPRLTLSRGAARATLGLAAYGTVANWAATLLAAFWGAGVTMPLAGGGMQGSGTQEALLAALLLSLSFAMIAVCLLVLWGLRTPVARQAPDALAVVRRA